MSPEKFHHNPSIAVFCIWIKTSRNTAVINFWTLWGIRNSYCPMKHYHWTLVSSWISGDVVSQNSTQANKEVCASFTKSAPWRRSCHNLSSSHCEYSAIYNESNVFLFPRRIIAAIHQNLANDVFHRFPSVWENRATEMEAQRHKSCQIRAELGSESRTEGKTKFLKKSE